MELKDYIKDENIELNFTASDKEEALKKLADLVAKNRNIDSNRILKVLKDREELGSTGIGNNVAIPHGKLDIEKDVIGAIAISKKGINFDSIDGKPVKIFFVFISSPSATNLHLKILAKVSKLLMDEKVRNSIISVKTKEEIKKIMANGG